jgi:signal peptidase I
MKELDELSKDDFEKLQKLPFFKGRIVSGSMDPVIKVGDQIVVEVGHPDLKRFDIIVFHAHGKLICHYIWAYNRIFTPVLFQTRSLFGNKDHPIDHSSYLGKVVSHKLSWWRKCILLLKRR